MSVEKKLRALNLRLDQNVKHGFVQVNVQIYGLRYTELSNLKLDLEGK